MRILLTVAALLWLAGCYPVTTTHPVGSSGALVRDTALIGAWAARSDSGGTDKPACIDIYKSREKLLASFHPCEFAAGSGKGEMRFELTSAVLGGRHFLNVTFVSMKDESGTKDIKVPGSIYPIPLLYILSGRTLTLYELENEKVAQAIEAKLIEGRRTQDGDWLITSEPAKLDAFVADPANERRFKLMMVMDRTR